MKDWKKYWDCVFLRFKKIYYPKILLFEKDKKIVDEIKNLKKLSILKTDLFEEAHGDKHLIFSCEKENKTFGIDISKMVIESAKAFSKKSFFVISRVEELPFKKESFDVIISTSTLDHLETKNIKKAMKELSRILKKGGILLLTLDSFHNPFYRIEFIFWKILNLYYRSKCFKIKEIVKMSKKCGLKIEKVESVMIFPAIIDKILIFFQIIFRIKNEQIYKFLLKIFDKIFNDKKYTKGRFLFFKLKKK